MSQQLHDLVACYIDWPSGAITRGCCVSLAFFIFILVIFVFVFVPIFVFIVVLVIVVSVLEGDLHPAQITQPFCGICGSIRARTNGSTKET
jgi:hypothetical protein